MGIKGLGYRACAPQVEDYVIQVVRYRELRAYQLELRITFLTGSRTYTNLNDDVSRS